MKEREFAGPVTGLQDIYRSGLPLLDERARALYGQDFKDLAGAQQDGIIDNEFDQAAQAFIQVALAQTLQAMYGAPEYGGNRSLVGWLNAGYEGDVQPRGHTDAQVIEPGAATSPLPLAKQQLGRLAMSNLALLRPQPAPRDAPWLARKGYPRG
jgi:hypothetical protein